jgi:transcriptional antiterminator RfaH
MILEQMPSADSTSLDAQARQPGWYCARTKPKHEHIAAASVVTRLGLEVVCPRLRVERPTRRGIVRLMEPLFPGYLFVRCVLEDKLDDLRHTNGVSSVVHFGGRVARVPDEVVAELQSHFLAEEPVVMEDSLKPGSAVVVASGAFEGMQASVLRTLPARRRVQILLEILGRPTMVEVERGWVTAEHDSLADRVPFMAAA